MPRAKAKNLSGLGKSIMNDRQKKATGNRSCSSHHVTDMITSEASKAKSVLERNALDDYLATVLTAGDNFEVLKEREIIHMDDKKVITKPNRAAGAAGVNLDVKVPIPRRAVLLTGPNKDEKALSLTAEQLDSKEQHAFLKWRQTLAKMEEDEGFVMTPFEKNIEFWRQLWRVIEKSEVVVQILDGRNPLFFRCTDMERYVKEVDPEKEVVILINKADFLPREMRRKWAKFFADQGVSVVFFSALRELHAQGHFLPQEETGMLGDVQEAPGQNYGTSGHSREEAIGFGSLTREAPENDGTDVLDCESLLSTLMRMAERRRQMRGGGEEDERDLVVGMVGFPNVGKSSVINALFGSKKTSVSRQPGKTKHFQTLPMPHIGVTLCDCPGLVFPNVVWTKHHLAINGVLPIEHFRGDIVPAIQLICDRIPDIICRYYGVTLPRPAASVRKTPGGIPLEARVFLGALCAHRKFYSGGGGGQPDYFRASRMVLRDFCTGRLPHCESPPPPKSLEGNEKARAAVPPGGPQQVLPSSSATGPSSSSSSSSSSAGQGPQEEMGKSGGENLSSAAEEEKTGGGMFSSDGKGFTSIFALNSRNYIPPPAEEKKESAVPSTNLPAAEAEEGKMKSQPEREIEAATNEENEKEGGEASEAKAAEAQSVPGKAGPEDSNVQPASEARVEGGELGASEENSHQLSAVQEEEDEEGEMDDEEEWEEGDDFDLAELAMERQSASSQAGVPRMTKRAMRKAQKQAMKGNMGRLAVSVSGVPSSVRHLRETR
uniref:CP-type G domain-containing protein n=1 Tax=Chromera velia CCMP2878 TaxID=1169474 RepID=A0A0G4G0F5_9ALVE|eukprot:Cvel_506.t1-p1 / transcript=Cvel_506.t1 / gene=Cvel_506 / organism=Chromera_velia_CCMP2878 / gene_product=Large subunit GTPase 1 homolog, putative / transcript_product=Large subunit GTPase 1 homolog, putative / location=Cvel_scaffold16:2044-5998(+) / protein_length=773 / sequence_SO=supercontig / SO=protein_coding / is_pseudo=false